MQLAVELRTDETLVMATTNDTNVEISCEMSAFIRPDSFLVWEGPGTQRLIGGTDKYQITFRSGSLNEAADGSSSLVSSRVSTLTISNPDTSDTGIYSCTVMGTNKAIAIAVVVNGTDLDTTDETSPTDGITTLPGDTTIPTNGITVTTLPGDATSSTNGITTLPADTTSPTDGITTPASDTTSPTIDTTTAADDGTTGSTDDPAITTRAPDGPTDDQSSGRSSKVSTAVIIITIGSVLGFMP